MNKQEIEQKLEEIYENHIGDDRALPSVVKEGLKIAFNLALDIAAENADGFRYDEVGQKQYNTKVDKESILKYKL